MGAYYAGMKLSPLDMSPIYAGTLMTITNNIGVMTPNASLLEWRTVFWVAFGVLFVTAVIYCIWASGEVQPFNNAPIEPRTVDFEAQERKPELKLKAVEHSS